MRKNPITESIEELDRHLVQLKIETAANSLLVGALYKHMATKLSDEDQKELFRDILLVRDKAFRYLLAGTSDPAHFELWKELIGNCTTHLSRPID